MHPSSAPKAKRMIAVRSLHAASVSTLELPHVCTLRSDGSWCTVEKPEDDRRRVGRRQECSLGEMISQLPQGVRVPPDLRPGPMGSGVSCAAALADKLSAQLAMLEPRTCGALAVAGAEISRDGRGAPIYSRLAESDRSCIRNPVSRQSPGQLLPFVSRPPEELRKRPSRVEDLSDCGWLSGRSLEDERASRFALQRSRDRYRVHTGSRHDVVGASAGVKRMVRSDLGAAGVMFTTIPNPAARMWFFSHPS